MNPSRVACLFGGYWEERSISIASARQVIPGLRSTGLVVVPVRWDAEGWVILPEGTDAIEADGEPLSPIKACGELLSGGLGVVFNCLHGGPGEDGTLQGLLTLLGRPFTGAGVQGSAITHNKMTFRERVAELGYDIAPGGLVTLADWQTNPNAILTEISVELGFPVIVKPNDSGSSVGVAIAADSESLEARLDESLSQSNSVLVEQFIRGREVSIACLGTRAGESPEVLPIVEIEPLTGTGFFDTESKYDPSKAKEVVPAPLDAELEAHLADLGATIHRELDLGGLSRTDVILSADGPVVLESQTVPGLSRESLFPKCAAAAGLEFPQLCRRVIDYALSEYLSRGVALLNASQEDDRS